MRWTLSLLVLFSWRIPGYCQTNLVPNPGFEEYHSCPAYLSQFNGIVTHWTTPTSGTPNYYHVCAREPEVGVPYNYFGHKPAIHGLAYTGIMTSNAFREYISVQLNSTLEAGKQYRVSFYTSLILQANCRSKGLDILLSKESPYSDQPGTNLHTVPTMSFQIEYRDESWIKSQACFQAKGGERFLTLGDMQYPQAHHDCAEGKISYYFIDEIVLEEIKPGAKKAVFISTCNRSLPVELDGAQIAGISQIPDKIQWDWDGSVKHRFRTIEKTGIYQLGIIYPNCTQDHIEVAVSDADCSHYLFIPNIFTPDGNGLNDYFEIKSKGIRLILFSLYNRNGQVVFSTSDPELKWPDNPEMLKYPAGVYVYLIRYKVLASDDIKQQAGSVTLIR